MNGDTVLRLTQIEQFPRLQLERDDTHSNCSICIGDFIKDEIILILPCIHKFHRCCIRTWLSTNNTCPTCRERVIHNVDEVANGDVSSFDEAEEESSESSGSISDVPEIWPPVSWSSVVNNFNPYFNTMDETSSSVMSFDRNSDSSDSSNSSILQLQSTSEAHFSSSDVSIHSNSSDVSIHSNSSDMSIHSLHSNSSSNTSIFSNGSLHSNSTINDISLANSDSSNSDSSNLFDHSVDITDMLSDDYSD